ncbi:MAG: hypothetical protein WEB88_06110 [Gemmatimonadota bacterium]
MRLLEPATVEKRLTWQDSGCSAESVPDEVAGKADLVELRSAVDPDGERSYSAG